MGGCIVRGLRKGWMGGKCVEREKERCVDG